MMKQYMKNKSRLGFFLAMCLGLFSCSKFLEENRKDKLPEEMCIRDRSTRVCPSILLTVSNGTPCERVISVAYVCLAA